MKNIFLLIFFIFFLLFNSLKLLSLSNNKYYNYISISSYGSCLFDSISISYSNLINSNSNLNNKIKRKELFNLSNYLRYSSIELLNSSNLNLILYDNIKILSNDLLTNTSKLYGLSNNNYCNLMLKSYSWGGIPEIITLSNLLNCSINIFEIVILKNDTKLYLNKTYSFGPVNKENQTHEINLLFTNGQFPYMTPKDVEEKIADHFLPLFEVKSQDISKKDKRKNWILNRFYNNNNNNSKKFRWKRFIFGKSYKGESKNIT